jgi:predicted small secreted protein
MKKLLLTAALVVGSLTFAGNMTPSFAQGAGGDVSTPRKSVPRVGIDKRDDSMNAGRPAAMKHARHKKHKKRKMKRMTQPGTTQGGSSSTPSMAPTGTSK